MGIKADLEEMFSVDGPANQPTEDSSPLFKILTSINIDDILACMDAINIVHGVISKAKNNPQLEELAKQLVMSGDLLNKLKLAVETTTTNKKASAAEVLAQASQDPFKMPLVTPKSGKITPTKAK